MFICVCIYLFVLTSCVSTVPQPNNTVNTEIKTTKTPEILTNNTEILTTNNTEILITNNTEILITNNTEILITNNTEILITNHTNNTIFFCNTRADCSIEEVSQDSRLISCLEGICYCDEKCFSKKDERCEVRKCYKYSFGTDTCEFKGRNWRITSILAKYTGFFGGVYFYLGRWILGTVQLSIFTAIIITLPVIIIIYCLIGYVVLRVGVKLRSLYGIVKRIVISVVCVCCGQCLCVCVCVVWYIVIGILVSQNLLKDAEGCGMANEPQYIHVV